MRRAVLIVGAVAALAGCGGRHTTNPQNTGSRNVAKPLVRPLIVKLSGSTRGTVRVRAAGAKTTTVSLQLAASAPNGATAELAKGSCGAPAGLQTAKALGDVSSRRESWSVPESLTQLTASPLAVVLRSGTKVIACGQVRQG
jgi:hypothetical protein